MFRPNNYIFRYTAFGTLAIQYILNIPRKLRNVDHPLKEWAENNVREKIQMLLNAGADSYKDNRWGIASLKNENQHILKQQIQSIVDIKQTIKEQMTNNIAPWHGIMSHRQKYLKRRYIKNEYGYCLFKGSIVR